MNQCGVLRGRGTLVSVDTLLEIHIHIINSLFISLLRQRVLKSEHASESPRRLVETLKLNPSPRVSDSGGWGWSSRISIFNNSLAMLLLLVRKSYFENHRSTTMASSWRHIGTIWEILKNSNAGTPSPKYSVSLDLDWSSDVGVFKKLSR